MFSWITPFNFHDLPRTLSGISHTYTISAAFSLLLPCQPNFKGSHVFLTSNVELLSGTWKESKPLKTSVSVKAIQVLQCSPFNKRDHCSATYWLTAAYIPAKDLPIQTYLWLITMISSSVLCVTLKNMQPHRPVLNIFRIKLTLLKWYKMILVGISQGFSTCPVSYFSWKFFQSTFTEKLLQI